MAQGRSIHLCTFDSVGDLRGKVRTYEAVKARVLAAGRFSVFDESSSGPKSAALFRRLRLDPEIEVFRLDYPWHGVRRRVTPSERGSNG